MRGPGWILPLAAGLGLLTLVAAGGTPAPRGDGDLVIAPGQLVRWEGEGSERCRLGDREWPAQNETCWFPIDLGTAPGPLTVVRQRRGKWEERRLTISAYPYPTQHIRLQDESKVNLSAADLARSARETAAVEKVWQRRGPARFELPLAPPLAPLPKGGRFGARRIFNGEARSPHSGADYAAAKGTPVLAAADGTVALAAEHFFSGRSVFLDHGDELFSVYFHLSVIGVREGQIVRRGERLGAVGATGRATGPHLHFGLRWHGARIDPALLLGAPGQVPALAP